MSNYIFIIAGPHGAGKTTFASAFIPTVSHTKQFINADLIAYGLSPFEPEKKADQARELMLQQIETSVKEKQNFCIETTLSGQGYTSMINEWKTAGYTINLIFLSLPNEQTALERIATRVQQGGQAVQPKVVQQHFKKSLINFNTIYKPIVDYWFLYDNWSYTNVAYDQPAQYFRKIENALARAHVIAREHECSLMEKISRESRY